MADRHYKVGQVLYVILANKPMVVPVCVLEKRTSETTEGVTMTYIVKSPKPDAPPRDLFAEVQGTVYTSIEEVKAVMMQNAQRAIDDMVGRAEVAAQKAFGRALPPPQRPAQPQSDDPFGSDPLGDTMTQLTPVPIQNGQNGAMRGPSSGEVVEVPQADGSVKKVMLVP